MRKLPLLLEQARMTGYTLPLAHIKNPRVSESSDVIVSLPLIGSLRVIDAGHHGRITEEVHLYILNIRESRLESGILDIGKEALFIAEFAIPFGIDEAAGDEGVQSCRVAIYLGFIPQALKNQQFAFARIGLLAKSDAAQA